jgi:hypothetical protein
LEENTKKSGCKVLKKSRMHEMGLEEDDLRLLSAKTRRKRPIVEDSLRLEQEDDNLEVTNGGDLRKLLNEKQRKRRKGEEEVGEGEEEGYDDEFLLLDGITKFIRQNNQAGMKLKGKIFNNDIDEENSTSKTKILITPSSSASFQVISRGNVSTKLDEIIRKSREVAEDKGLQLELVLTQIISKALFTLKLNNLEGGRRDLQNILKEVKKLRTRHELDRTYLRSCLLSHQEEEEEEEEGRRKGREAKGRKRTDTTTGEGDDERGLLPLEILWQLQSYSPKLSSSSISSSSTSSSSSSSSSSPISQLQRIQKETEVFEMEEVEEPLIDLCDYILDLTPKQTSLFLSQLKSLGLKSTTASQPSSTSFSSSADANRRRTQLLTQQLQTFQNYIRFLVSGSSISTSSSSSSSDSRTTDNSSSNMYHNQLGLSSTFEGKLFRRQQER